MFISKTRAADLSTSLRSRFDRRDGARVRSNGEDAWDRQTSKTRYDVEAASAAALEDIDKIS
jgi:hypothetical protein